MAKRPKISANWAKRLCRNESDGVADARNRIAFHIADIEKQLANPTPLEFGHFTVGAEFISIYYARLAVADFAKLETGSAWSNLSRALDWHLASFKGRFAQGFPNGTALDLTTAALIYCTAVALKCREVGEWLATFITSVVNAEKSSLQPKDPDAFQLLAFELAALTCGTKRDPRWRAQLETGIYGPLLAADSAEAAQEAILELAISRGELSVELPTTIAPFTYCPYNLFPVEILAILTMNQLEMYEFDFGAMESPLCHPPVELPWEKPELLVRMETRIREKYDLPDINWS